MYVMVLNDGETFTDINGCAIYQIIEDDSVPDVDDIEEYISTHEPIYTFTYNDVIALTGGEIIAQLLTMYGLISVHGFVSLDSYLLGRNLAHEKTTIPDQNKKGLYMPAKIGAIQAAQDVLDKGYFGVPVRRRIDAFTASLIVQIADKLNPTNRAKLDAMSVRQAAVVCWKLNGGS